MGASNAGDGSRTAAQVRDVLGAVSASLDEVGSENVNLPTTGVWVSTGIDVSTGVLFILTD